MNTPISDQVAKSFANAFDKLSLRGSLNDNLDTILKIVKITYADIGRISVAMYDPCNDSLKSYLSSKGLDEPLAHFEAPLNELEGFLQLTKSPSARLVRHFNDQSDCITAQVLLKSGYLSSYLVPIFDGLQFIGVVAFSSSIQIRFDSPNTRMQIDVVVKFVSLLIISDIYAIEGLKGIARTLKEVVSLRDNETGEHLERMSRYSRLIAKRLAREKLLSDEYIEDLFQCAPLHDIGKIAIPDRILLKPGALTDSEFSTMKLHTVKGRDIIERALHNLRIEDKKFTRVLLNIVYSHHENWDGTGYPEGIQGERISLEARIIRVADVYDALTSERPYKAAWTHEQAIEFLICESGKQFDPMCVQAAINCSSEFSTVADKFVDP